MTGAALLATIVDTKALAETIGYALLAGVGVALTFSLAILGAARFAEASRDGDRTQAVMFAALAVAGVAASLAAITFGIIVMTSS